MITIPIEYLETIIDYGQKESITQNKWEKLQKEITRIFGVPEIEQSCNVHFQPPVDERVSDACKQISGKLFKIGDVRKAQEDLDKITKKRCFQVPMEEDGKKSHDCGTINIYMKASKTKCKAFQA